MSAAGVIGSIVEQGKPVGDCLLIGAGVPRIHHSDGIPVFLVVEHPEGTELTTRGHLRQRLLAYPSAWPRPGGRGERWVFAKHEALQWSGLLPLFDRGDA